MTQSFRIEEQMQCSGCRVVGFLVFTVSGSSFQKGFGSLVPSRESGNRISI